MLSNVINIERKWSTAFRYYDQQVVEVYRALWEDIDTALQLH